MPRSVPLQRHPPPSDRFARVTSSTQLIGTDARAEKRNADQIRNQTSGEIGRFYIDSESEAVKLGKTLLKPPPPRPDNLYEMHSGLQSALPTNRSLLSSRKGTDSARSDRSTSRSDYGNSSRDNFHTSAASNKYMTTLQTLDRTFSNSDRRDLFAASMPGRSAQELVWCAANNNRGALQSKGWAQRLRKESTTQGL